MADTYFPFLFTIIVNVKSSFEDHLEDASETKAVLLTAL